MLNFKPFDIFGLHFTSKLYILEAFKHLPLFYPKYWNMMSLKHVFSEKKSMDFSEIFKLMTDKMMDKRMTDRPKTESFGSISADVFEL